MRYRAAYGGQPEPDLLLVQLKSVPRRPVVRLRLPAPVTDIGDKWHGCVETIVISDDEPNGEMSGDVELPDGTLLAGG